jgi:hypothetical protein
MANDESNWNIVFQSRVTYATNDKTKMLVARDILEKAAEQNGQFNEGGFQLEYVM